MDNLTRPMPLFGPAGNSERFYAEGYKRTAQAPAWLAAQGLTAFEYSAGRGVTLSDAAATEIGDAARRAGVTMSIHAPYFINLANPERLQKNIDYLTASARAVRLMGGRRVVFHPGSPAGAPRDQAFSECVRQIRAARSALDRAGCGDILLCPETMGKKALIGSLDEIIELCLCVGGTLPTIDFGHLHARDGGALTDGEAFGRVLDRMIQRLGQARVKCFHAHFSRISFTDKGEKQHMTFADPGYGPDFALLAPQLISRGLTPTVICESAGTQADDAAAMRRIYLDALD